MHLLSRLSGHPHLSSSIHVICYYKFASFSIIVKLNYNPNVSYDYHFKESLTNEVLEMSAENLRNFTTLRHSSNLVCTEI